MVTHLCGAIVQAYKKNVSLILFEKKKGAALAREKRLQAGIDVDALEDSSRTPEAIPGATQASVSGNAAVNPIRTGPPSSQPSLTAGSGSSQRRTGSSTQNAGRAPAEGEDEGEDEDVGSCNACCNRWCGPPIACIVIFFRYVCKGFACLFRCLCLCLWRIFAWLAWIFCCCGYCSNYLICLPKQAPPLFAADPEEQKPLLSGEGDDDKKDEDVR